MGLETTQIMEQLRKARSTAKANVTKKANKVNELLTDCNNVESIKEIAKELDNVLQHFENAHIDYHNLLKDEQDIKDSTCYFNSVNELVSEIKSKILSRLDEPVASQTETQENQNEIRPEDSVSSAGSQKSKRSSRQSGISSIKSSSSAKTRAAARQAALEAKANALHKLHELQLEELKIQQKKSQVELQAEIAAAEAEKIVYEQSEEELHSNPSYAVENSSPPVLQQDIPTTASHTQPTSANQAKLLQSPMTAQMKQQPIEQQLNPSAHQWVPSQPSLAHHNSHASDYSFQRLMETQDRQNTTLQQLVQQQQQSVMALQLPQPTIKVFKGDPLEYCDFIRSFEHLVEEKTLSPSARLYYLIQHTTGSVQDLMKSCLAMSPEQGYEEAKKLLKERYGQNYRIAAAQIRHLTDGPLIKSEDGNALLQYSIQLTSCANTLEQIGSLSKLDHPENLKAIVNRLPFGMRLKWRDTVDRIIENENRDVTIKDVTAFVTAKARAATHPIFGKVVNEQKGRQEDKGKRSTNPRASGFATQGGHLKERARDDATRRGSCPCNENHWLPRCDKFRKLSIEERKTFVRNNKLCLNCLTTGHFVRDCPKSSFCKVEGCTGKHSTFLHPKQPSNDRQNKDNCTPPDKRDDNQDIKVAASSANNGYVKITPKTTHPKSSTVTGLAIVPVRVRAAGRSELVETYAFLDSGSNTSFCTDELLKRLNEPGRKTRLSLTTMLGVSNPIECSVVRLEIFDLDNQNCVELPNVYSTPILPIRPECIGKQEDVERWPHLTGISIPHIDAEIGLLIGSDAPEILQPRETRMSEDGGPFATKTLFGWVLNGPLSREDVGNPTSNFLQVENNLDQRFEQFCNMEFNDVTDESKVSMSKNDVKALEIMKQSARLVSGHYEIRLPWKDYPPPLSNNRVQAEQRLSSLRKRLLRDPSLLQQYKQFMDDLLTNDHARKV